LRDVKQPAAARYSQPVCRKLLGLFDIRMADDWTEMLVGYLASLSPRTAKRR
jgi:hypothetical protein